MTHPPVCFNPHNPNPVQSGSSFKTKRKRMSWAEGEDEGNKLMRIRSPPPVHAAGQEYSLALPELTMESAPTSDDDQGMDQDMDGDMDMEHDTHMAMGFSGRAQGYHAQEENYTYSQSGSGGFGFGPGAEEDELDMMDDMGASTMKDQYNYGVQSIPSLTPHPNPHHFSNTSVGGPFGSLSSNSQYVNNPNFARASSPLAAQPFATTLPAPKGAGLLQPSFAGPLPDHANDVERARSGHGPQCTSIPKLVMSEHPDPATGKRSLWSLCADCGACEMAQ